MSKRDIARDIDKVIAEVGDEAELTRDEAYPERAVFTDAPRNKRELGHILRGRGRPGLSASGSKVVGFKTTPDQHRKLAEYAESHGTPVSSVVRDAVDEYLAHHTH